MFANKEINLRNMFLTMLLRWRVIIVAMCLSAIILPVAKYVSFSKQEHNTDDNYREDQIEQVEQDFVEEERVNKNVEELIELYQEYKFFNGILKEMVQADVDVNNRDADVETAYYLVFARDVITARINQLEASISKEMAKYAKDIADGKTGIEKPEIILTPISFVWTKYVIFGMFGGLLVTVLPLAFSYIISDKLYCSYIIPEQAGIRLLGTLEMPDARKQWGNSIDKMIIYGLHTNKRKMDKTQQLNAIVSATVLFAEQNGIRSICFTSTVLRTAKDVMEQLASMLLNEKMEVKLIDDIAYDKDALREGTKSDGIIIVEQIGESLLTEIEKEIIVAKEYNVSVVGAIVLE